MAKDKPKTAADAAEAVAPVAPAADAGAASDLQDALAPAGAQPEATQQPHPTSPPSPPAEVKRCDVRVLAQITIDEVRYLPNTIIEGLPVTLAEAYKDRVDAHPEAVAYARSIEAPVVAFEPAAE